MTGLLSYIGLTDFLQSRKDPMILPRKPSRGLPPSAVAALLSFCASPLLAQAPRSLPLEADHYDVSARLDADTQSIAAVAQVEFHAREASSVARVELHPNL